MTTPTPQDIEKAAGMMRSWRTRKESPAECLAAALAAERARWQAECERLRNRIDTRLDDCLCEMKEGYDDSIAGFNEAWDIVREVFAEAALAQPATAERE